VGLSWLAGHVGEMYGLAVAVEADEGCRVPTRELRVLLLQLVRELLFNVVKHADVEEARLTMTERDGYYVITVADEGRGFDLDAQSADPTSGFGLYSVGERLELLGGRLEIEAAPGEGTRVTLYAPITTPD
ncbi:MAG: ATP-binding protein, partial [Rhodothermales bacterium]|nr:ATP-binding protein [Rhodothermales bacterium]